MSRGGQVALALALAVSLGGCALRTAGSAASVRGAAHHRGARAAGQLSLITEPPAGIGPVLAAIRRARRTVELVMYEDEDEQVDAALAAARARGVSVRVLLNGGYYGEGSPDNRTAYAYLHAHRVDVRWTPSYFALTHQKSLVVDVKDHEKSPGVITVFPHL
jgi:phosphatidylserine/phosphatidylglycerophosphate/cardiolipin synthase-like enzyme